MRKLISKLLTLGCILAAVNSNAQMTAMDFNRNDCNGNPQHLFADLNAGKVVIIEYFMTSCAPCPAAGQKLELMKANLLQQYPGKVKSYAIAFNNTYSCSTVVNWVNSNGFTSIPMDSGATQVAYYGGMGMPTIIIAAGTSHQLLGSPYIGFVNSDTTQMASNIRAFLNAQVGVKQNTATEMDLKVFPNPSSNELHVNFSLATSSEVSMEILDMNGKLISTLTKEKMQAGRTSRSYPVSSLASGNYILRIKTDENVSQQKFTVAH